MANQANNETKSWKIKRKKEAIVKTRDMIDAALELKNKPLFLSLCEDLEKLEKELKGEILK